MKGFFKRHQNKLILLFITAMLYLSLFIPLHLPGNPSDYGTEGTDIVFRYEIFGCGSLIRKIEKGGSAIYTKANLPEPDSGVYEIQLSPDSDEPMRHINSGEFYTGGLAGKYSYYMKLEVVGVARGAPECCEETPAYNEVVPLVKVIKWEPTTFTPEFYYTLRHEITILIIQVLVIANCVMLLISIYSWIKRKKQISNKVSVSEESAP